jgi:parvulin-like peptidyl-prolyl isomerase
LLVLINARGIYENDARREIEADRFLAGESGQSASKDAILQRLIANENLRQLSRHEILSTTELQRESNSLQYQFADDKLWRKRMHDMTVSPRELGALVRENVYTRSWIEHSLANRMAVDDQILRSYYGQHLLDFAQPLRLRASHIFLAAPPESPPEVVEAKQQLIESLAARLRAGEQFDHLVWEASEDEATKARGGDLGYFSEWRIPHDFFSTVSQLKIGEPPKVIRSFLGFHIVRLTEIKLARQIPFEEARSAIASELTNEHRRKATETLAARLSGSSALRGD